MHDRPSNFALDVQTVGRLDAIPALLDILCESTGMGFAAVARVSDLRWTACAVRDELGLGMKPGDELDVERTFCRDVGRSLQPVYIDHASFHPDPRSTLNLRPLGLESCISVPIVRADDEWFGTLCAADRAPKNISEPRMVRLFEKFARLIADHLDDARAREARETRMSSLINDVLDFARGRSGPGPAVRFESVAHIESIFEACVRSARVLHPKRKIIANITVGRRLCCDPLRLQQLAEYLLDNALNAGSAMGPVSFIAFTEGSDLVVEVWNDGEPLSLEERESMFTPFTRSRASVRGGGNGLLILLSAQIVRSHDGTIGVTSSAEHGTQFIVRIPLQRPL